LPCRAFARPHRVAAATETKPYEDHADRVARLEGARLSYVIAIEIWISTANFFDWRRRLAGIGVPAAASWVLAPIGLAVIIVSSIAGFYSESNQ
jgi:hypothetical protein